MFNNSHSTYIGLHYQSLFLIFFFFFLNKIYKKKALKFVGIMLLTYLGIHEIIFSYCKATIWKFEGIEEHDNFKLEIIDA